MLSILWEGIKTIFYWFMIAVIVLNVTVISLIAINEFCLYKGIKIFGRKP